MITECYVDKSNTFSVKSDSLEMLIITDSRVDFYPLFENITYLTYLDLSFDSLTNIPSDIASLRMLRVLKLSGNEISNIPSEIEHLEFLQVLDLSRNMISHLPREIWGIRSLIFIDCSCNTLFSLPENISNLPYLEILHLHGNMLTTLPVSFSLLKRLQRLNLSKNRFEIIPFCVFECISLREFVFSYNQASGVIPDNICRLTDLEILNLAFNKFTKLPGKLFNLTKLKLLNVKGNDIKRIPEEIFSRCNDLSLINFASCGLTNVPATLNECKNLRVLDFSCNSLHKLPADGTKLKNLVSIFLVKNSISEIPKWICELPCVITISLRKNKLQSLPDDFKQVAEKLREIDLSNNHFESIPLCLFSKESKLLYFHMDYNPILAVPPEICNLKFLTHLSISNCPYIYDLPDEIGSLRKLRTLRVCSNSLLKLPPTLIRLGDLAYLDLSDNKFSRFPLVVCFIPRLRVLLYNNCCHTCTYLEPDPPGWFDRTNLIDPNASLEKLGKNYIEEVEKEIAEKEEPITFEEALASEEAGIKIPQLKPDEIDALVFKRRPHRIPKFICRLKFLVHLSLQHNGIYFLPNVFDRLKRLKRIYLNDNNLRKVPTSLATCKSLTDIDLRNNKLTEINAKLHKLPYLKSLKLEGNNFPACLNEVVKHSKLKGLCAYLDAVDRNKRKYFLAILEVSNWVHCEIIFLI